MQFDSLLFQIGSLLLLAAIIGLISHRLKQPLFLAYIFTGIIVAIFGGEHLQNLESLHFFSQLGIAFLLFMVGLELEAKNIRHLGKTVTLTALTQIAITATISFSIAIWIGLGLVSAIYIALAMTIASAVIAVKYLNDKGVTDSLHGKIDLGLHLVQDIVAVIAIILLSSWSANSGGQAGLVDAALVISKGALLITAHVFFSQYVLPRLLSRVATSSELLLLFSIAWCVFGAAAAHALGLSVEVGAFLAGVSLSSSSYQFQIAANIKPLRDFFVVVFFITLGSQMTFASPAQVILPALLLSAVVIVLNPLVTAILLGRFGYKRHTAFFASILMSQIGEFSLVLGALGVANQHLSAQEGSLVTATVVITMVISSIIIKHEHQIYQKLKPLLMIIERPDVHERRVRPRKTWRNHVVVLGAHRLGSEVLDALQRDHNTVVAVDYDPDRVKLLSEQGYVSIFGDATDDSVLREINIDEARLIISTLPQHHATLQLLRQLSTHQLTGQIIVTASTIDEAMLYYRLGAAYVIVPKLISSGAMSHLVKEHLSNPKQLENLKLDHMHNMITKENSV